MGQLGVMQSARVLAGAFVVIAGVGCGARTNLDDFLPAVVEGPSGGDGGGDDAGEPSDSASGETQSDAPSDGEPADASSCVAACTPGATRCQGSELSTCTVASTGCAAWAAAVACGAQQVCDGTGQAASCVCGPGTTSFAGTCAQIAPSVDPPRPVGPLSTATATSQKPVFHWSLAGGTDGAYVEICSDRACSQVVTDFVAKGSSGAPPIALARGVYFWRVRGTTAGAIGSSTSRVWEVFVGAGSARVNTSWGTTLDVDGDGLADVIAGAPEAGGYVGAAYLYLGTLGGASSSPVTLASPSATQGEFGSSVASAGDVDGDGFADVVVGACNCGAQGSEAAAYVYLGGAGGLSTTPITLSDPGTAGSLFGRSVRSAGDVNGDGYADIVVGAYGSNAAYLYLGSASGPSTPPVTLQVAGSVTLGSAATGVGDVNGDGYADVLVGDDGFNQEQGVAYLFFGGPGGLSSSPVVFPAQGGQDQGFGTSVADPGDLDGDGYADVVVGAEYNGNGGAGGAAYVYPGAAAGPSTTPSTTLTDPDGARDAFGGSVSASGDVNGDGFADLVVGSYFDDADAGAIFLYLGSASGLSTTPARLSLGTAGQGDYLGGAVAIAGDIDGDGYADVIAGAQGVSNSTGGAYVYLGGSSSLKTTPVLLSSPSANADFGFSVASAASSKHRARTRPARRAV